MIEEDNDNWLLAAPILGRLYRFIDEGSNAECVSELAQRLLDLKKGRPVLTRRLNAVLERLYDAVGPDLRHAMVEVWQGDSRLDSTRCWLKVATRDPAQFNPAAVFGYWQITRDPRAAKLIATQAPPSFLVSVLPALIEGCNAREHWLVSRAAIRSHEAERIGLEILAAIKGRSLASYAYVCAMTGTPMTHEEAIAMVRATTSEDWGGSRGLVIWSIGRLGMWDSLDCIRDLAPELREADEAAVMCRFGLLIAPDLDAAGRAHRPPRRRTVVDPDQ
jgi:hypothetical protein